MLDDNTGHGTVDTSGAGDNRQYFEALRKAVNNGDVTVKQIRDMAKEANIDVTALIEYTTMSRLEMEQNPYYKSDLSGQKTIVPNDPSVLKEGESVEVAGCKITCLSEGDGTGDYMGRKYKCESDYLGTFEYNPYEFEIGYKEIDEDDGSKSQLPVLQFCGTGALGGHRGVDVKFLWWDIGTAGDITIDIPQGVKSIDYTFTNNKTLEKVPDMPNSITSAHYAFAGCSNMDATYDGTTNSKRVYLPHYLEDMSGMFKDCTSISGHFCTGQILPFGVGANLYDIPSSVVNITDAWSGCESMDEVHHSLFGDFTYSVPGYGGTATPYLCADFAKNALDGAFDSVHTDDIEYVIESGGTINPDYADFAGTLDKDKLAKTQVAGAQAHQGDLRLGSIFANAGFVFNNAQVDNETKPVVEPENSEAPTVEPVETQVSTEEKQTAPFVGGMLGGLANIVASVKSETEDEDGLSL